MANNKIQVKRTNVAGRTANVTNSGNTQFIDAGEFALNMADGILYTSNGSALITVGANQVNQRITNSLTFDNDRNLLFRTVNTSASVGFRQQNDDNFVFYSTNTAYGQRAVWSIFANSITSAFSISVPTVFNANINLGQVALIANNNSGSAGQVLTTNGTSTYWSTVSGSGSVNTAAQFAWTNTHTFSANVSFTGNGIGITTNTGAIYLGGLADNNWKIGRNTGSITKWVYTNNTIDIVTANSNLEGFVVGLVSNNSYFETGYLGTYIASNVTVGNSTSNLTVNSTAFVVGNSRLLTTNVVFGGSITANGSVGSAGQVLTSGATGNAYWTTPTTGTVTSVASGNGITGGTITSTGTLTAVAGAGVVVNTSGINVLANNGITSNSTGTFVTTGSGVAVNSTGVHVLANTGIIANTTGTFVNATYIGTISANNASFLGTVAAASYVQNTDSRTLSGNLNFTGVNNFFSTGLFVGANVFANVTTIFVGNSTVNATYNSGLFQVANSTATSNLTAQGLQAGANVVANTTALRVGNTTFTTTNAVFGGTIAANGGIGSAGQVLTSGAAGNAYWTTPTTGTVTSVASGNGITGGTITATGTLVAVAGAGVVVNTSGINVLANNGIVANSTGTFVNANTGIVANATGVFVNATYIGTISANNASFLGGTAAASYVQNTDSRTLSGNLVFSGANVFFQSATLGGTATNFVNNFIISTNVGNGSFLRFYHYRHTTGGDWTGVSTRLQQRIDVTDMGYLEYNPSGYSHGIALYGGSGYGLTVSQTGQSIFGNTIFLGSVGLSANGSLGTAGHVLHSNGTATYWAADDNSGGTVTSVATGNGLTGGTITTTGTVSVLANTGIVANATGLYVNATYIGTLSANNASFLGGTAAASYQLNSTLAANVATLTANAATTPVFSGDSVTKDNITTRTESGIYETSTGTFAEGWPLNSSNWQHLISVTHSNDTNYYAMQISGSFFDNDFYGRKTNNVGTASWVKFWTDGNDGDGSGLDADTLDGVQGASYVQNTDSRTLSGNLNFTGTNNFFSTGLFVGANVTANTTAFRVGNSNLSTVNLSLGGQVTANGGVGSSGQVLTSGGAGNVYWAAAGGGGVYMKGGTSTVGSLATEGQNIFRVNANTLNNSTTVASGENAQATGPLTIGAGITLTVSTGGRVSIV